MKWTRQRTVLVGAVCATALGGLWWGGGLIARHAVEAWATPRINGSLHIDAVHLGLEGAVVEGIHVQNPRGEPVLDVNRLSVRWGFHQVEARGVDLHVTRRVSGDLSVSDVYRPGGGPSTWTGTVILSDSEVAWKDDARSGFQAVVDHVAGHLDATPDHLHATLSGKQKDATLVATADRNETGWQVQGQARGIDLETWGNYGLHEFPVVVDGGQGDVDVSLWDAGPRAGSPQTVPDLLVTGQIHGGAFQIPTQPGPVRDIDGTFTVTPGCLELSGITARLGPLDLALDGRILDFEHPRLDVTLVSGKPLPLWETLQYLHLPAPPVDGRVSARLHFAGAPQALQIGWEADAPDLTWKTLIFDHAHGSGTWAGGTLQVAEASVGFFGGEVGAHGWLFPDRLWMKVHGRRIPIQRVARLFPALAVVGRASGNLDLTLLGNPTDPIVTGTAGLGHARVRGVTIRQAQTGLTWHDGTLFIRRGRVQSDQGDFLVPNGFVDVPKGRYLVYLQARHWHFPSLSAGFWGRLQGALDGTVAILGTPGQPPVVGGQVTGGDIQFGRLHFTDVKAPLWISPGTAESAGGTARYDGRQVYFRGSTRLPPHFALDLGLYVPDTPLPQVQGDLPFHFPFKMAGNGPAWIDILGGPDFGVGWDITTCPETGTFLTQGFVGPHDEGLTAYVVGKRADAERLAPDFTWRFHPQGRADIAVEIDRLGDTVDTRYTWHGQDLRIDGGRVTHGVGGLQSTGDTLEVLDNFFLGPTADVAVRGRKLGDILHLAIDANPVNLARAWRELDLARWDVPIHNLDPYFDVPTLQGEGRIVGRIDGPVEDPTFVGRVDIPQGSISGEPFRLGGKVRLTSHVLDIFQGDFARGQSRMAARGRMFMTKPMGYDLDVWTHGSQAADLLGGLRLPLQATGEVDGKVHVSGTTLDPLLTGTVSLNRPTVFGQPLDRLSAVFRAVGRRLELRSLHGVLGAGRVDMHGILGPLSQINLGFNVQNVALADLRILDLVGTRHGTLSGQGHFQGYGPTVKGGIDITGAGIQMGGRPFDQVHLRTTFSPQAVSLDPFSVTGPSGNVTVQGSVVLPHGYSHPTQARLDIESQAHNLDLGLFSPFLPVSVTGRLRGHTRWTGPWQKPDMTFDLIGQDVTVGMARLGSVAVAGISSPREVRLDTLSFEGPDSSGSVEGVWDPGRSLSGEAHVHGFDLSTLPQRVPLTGRLSLDATVDSKDAKPALHVTAKVENGTVNGYRFDTLTGGVDLSQGILRLDDVEANGPKTKVRLSGTLPLSWQNGGPVSTGDMNLQATLDQSDLSMLTLELPHIESTSGTFKGSVNVGGTLARPHLQGQLQISDGSMKFDFMATPLQRIEMDARLAGDRLDLHRLEGQLGGGNITVTGFAELDNFFDPGMHFQLHGNRMGIDMPKLFNGKADADLGLQGTMKTPALAGQILIREGNIYASEDLQAPKGEAAMGLPPIDMNLSVAMGQDVYLKFFGSSIKTRGQLTLKGVAPGVHPVGDLKTVSGTVNLPFLGLFKVDGGHLRFDGSGFLPFVDVTAESNIGNYQVFLRWQGDLKDPPKQPVTLSSNPPMSQSDIMLLMQGRPPVAGGPALAGPPVNPFNNVLANVGSATVAQPVLEAVGKVFALSDVTLQTSVPNLYSIKLARALDSADRLFFTATRFFGPLGQVQALYGLEYRPRIGFMIQAATGDLGAYSFFLQSTHRF